MTMPILFIHGRGKNTDRDSWIEALRETIRGAGHTPPSVDCDEFITASYTDLLEPGAELPDVPMPRVTLAPADLEARARFLEQAIILRDRFPRPRSWLTGQQLADVLTAVTVRKFPLAHLPIQDRGLVDVVLRIMGDVERYRSDAGLRANILGRVLEQVPETDELIIVGHSLGSVVALDLLSYLPEQVQVPLFLTFGSPLSYRAIQQIGLPGATAPLPFPHEKVARWVNVVDTFDPVTGFTGVHNWWPEAVDMDVDNPSGRRHSVRAYLSHPAVGELVGEARGVSRTPAVPSYSLDTDLQAGFQHEELLAEIAIHFARCLLESEDDDSARQRARAARDELMRMLGSTFGRRLTLDQCEAATHSWRDQSSQLDRRVLVARLAFSNPFEPFDPGISAEARTRALSRLCKELAIPDAEEAAVELVTLIERAQKAVLPRSKTSFVKPLLVGVSTIGLVAIAAPAAVGLFAAAGAGGAAAFTSGLAALGGGGMAAGIGVIGGAGAGGGLLAAQLARSGTDKQAVAMNLTAIGATIRWLRRWGDEDLARRAAEFADGIPLLIHEYESQLAFHVGKSAPNSDPVEGLRSSIKQADRLVAWLAEKAAGDELHRNPAGADPTAIDDLLVEDPTAASESGEPRRRRPRRR
jgi:hypothetical protein